MKYFEVFNPQDSRFNSQFYFQGSPSGEDMPEAEAFAAAEEQAKKWSAPHVSLMSEDGCLETHEVEADDSAMVCLMADTGGIHFVDTDHFPTAEWLSFSDFRASLRTLPEDEEIFCTATREELDAINEEYGVR